MTTSARAVMRPAHLAFALLISTLWGFNLVAVKIGVDHLEPFLFSVLRFLLLLVLLLPWLKPVPGQMGRILFIGAAGGLVHFSLFFLGLRLADQVAAVAVLTQLYIPIGLILAVAFLGERIGWRRSLGLAAAFGGVLVIGFDARVARYLDAVILLVIANVFLATSQVLMRGLREVPVLTLQAWTAAVALPGMLALSLMLEDGQMSLLRKLDWRVAGAVVYAALIGSLLGHGGTYFLLKRYPVNMVSPMLLLTPVFAAIAAIAVLGDVISGQIVIGSAITIAGLLVITLRTEGRA